MSVTADEELDCSGLACPMPILKTKKAVDALAPGQILKMISTDPGSQSDIEAWTSRTGNPLLASETSGDTYTFFIQKSA
jgi:tRNA 2-thiouridine synthesizing protein A